MKIILGSSSPRRKDILSSIFNSFEIIKPDTDESVLQNESAHEYCLRVAIEKRESLIDKAANTKSSIMLIASDTTVSLDDHILGKPSDHADAVRMISILQGKTHQVLSSLAIYTKIDNREFRFEGIESTDVSFKKLTKDEIENYLAQIHYLDKAGSYAAQEKGDLIIGAMKGSKTNVIGFPLRLFFKLCSTNGLITNLFNE